MNTTQIVSQIFSYSFVFLLGVIVGALGEMYFDKRHARQHTDAVEPSGSYQDENVSLTPLPQDRLDVPVAQPVMEPEEIVEPALPPPPVLNQPAIQPSYPEYAPVPLILKEDSKKVIKQQSIAEQIDEILEELQKFSNSPLPPVSLKDDGRQGVIVKVGANVYPGIDAIPDAEVKALISKAVAEWERRSARK
jgi:hypothetical protein